MLTAKSALCKDRVNAYSTLEHRHFATVAAIIRELPFDTREYVIQHFADRLAPTNPKFNRARFIRACEL